VTHNIVNNTVNVGTAVNSPVQQSGHHSTQHQSIAYGADDLRKIERLMTDLTDKFEELKLDPNQAGNARAQIATLQAQLGAADPDPTILRQAGKSLRNITEGAIAGLIVAGAQPEIWQWIAHAMKALF
jgi:hypothetical protein